MAEHPSKALVRRFVEEVINAGDYTPMAEPAAANFVNHHPSGRTAVGLDALIDGMAANRMAFPDWHETIEDILADGDKVVVRATAHGTHQGTFMGIAPTGRAVSMAGIDIFRIEDGKLVEHWGVGDLPSLLQQLATLPDLG
jgi:steroid delta-isomerase-like uncharacterized protein